ncbi:MAG: cyclic nucleotide-binding domain-containing protein, partial [Bdellovibrionota bacterium]
MGRAGVGDSMEKIDIFEGMEGSELLQSTFLFRNLSFDEAAALARLFTPRSYRKGETLLEQDAIGESLYLIEKGRADVTKGDGQSELFLAELGPGELFGEMSLIEDRLTSATVKAKEAVTCLVLPKANLKKMMEGDARFALKVFQAFCFALSERLRKTTNELFEARKSGGKSIPPAVKVEAKPAAGASKKPAKKA